MLCKFERFGLSKIFSMYFQNFVQISIKTDIGKRPFGESENSSKEVNATHSSEVAQP